MNRKHVILFGATGGIGQKLLGLLLREGYDITLAVRSIPSAEVIFHHFIADTRNSIRLFQVDLADAQSIRDFLLRIEGERMDLLVFASGVRGDNSTNLDFEINYVAPITITCVFLRKFPFLTVINVTSGAAFRFRIDSPRELFHKSNSSFGGNYAKSKLALALASYCLSNEFPDSRIISVDPGSNRTKMTLGNGAPVVLRIAAKLFFPEPLVGAKRIMKVITSRDIPSGVHVTAKGKLHDLNPYKNLASYLTQQIDNGFPYMPV